jgi:tetratricopeptide (TPR) repeat protein
MSRIALTLLMIIPVCSYGRPVVPDGPREMLAQAEQLYEKAEFQKSIELLLRADELLQKQPGSPEETTSIKMQLALAYMGLNNSDRAKFYFRELYRLDPDYRLDSENLAPKVLDLGDEARTEEIAAKCHSILEDAQKQLQSGSTDNVVKLIGSNRDKCSAMSSLASRAAELIFKDGLELFRNSQIKDALKKFRTAQGLDPANDLAGQYVELTQNKLEITADRSLIAFHKDFDAGDYVTASHDYQELVSVSDPKTINDVRQEYRQALNGLSNSWKRACASGDAPSMEKILTRAKALVPEPEIGEDILATMQGCAPTGCIPTDGALAITRAEKRPNPQFPASVLARIKNLDLTVRVKARIDVKGNVEIKDIQGGDPLLYSGIRTAVEQWKFRPTITVDGVRCVDTEFPIAIHPVN